MWAAWGDRPERRHSGGRGWTAALAGLAALALAGFGPLGAAAAQDDAALRAEFDAHGFSAAERRLLQIGLALDASYAGLIDGRWGGAAQVALETNAARRGVVAPGESAPAVPMLHAVLLAVDAMAFVIDHDLGYRGGAEVGHRMLTPPGAFKIETGGGREWRVLREEGLEITQLVADARETAALHAVIAGAPGGSADRAPLRRADRMVSAGPGGGLRVYARSDLAGPDGLWVTTIVEERPGADPRLAPVVAASITTDGAADIRIAEGQLVDLALAAAALADRIGDADPAELALAAAPHEAALPAPEPSDAFETALGAGTAFFVTATELVTAAHVVEDCAEVTLEDGAPLAVLALHPTLDLALLGSPRRSASYLPIETAPRVRLGEGVFALGYPLYGTLGTGLSMTRGNVSAITGLGDDPSGLTVTAPIHPGNSGGPLLSDGGEILGVVVATIDKLQMAESFGAIPENISFAVTGAELAAFLDAESVLRRGGARRPLEADGAVPEATQAAVVPVLCWGG